MRVFKLSHVHFYKRVSSQNVVLFILFMLNNSIAYTQDSLRSIFVEGVQRVMGIAKNDDGFVLTGFVENEEDNLLLLFVDKQFNVQNNILYGRHSDILVTQDIMVSSTGNIYVTGYPNNRMFGFFVLKFTSTGGFLWGQRYENEGDSGVGMTLREKKNGNIILNAGIKYDHEIEKYADRLLVEIDENGLIQYARQLNSLDATEIGNGCIVTTDGGTLLAGAIIEHPQNFGTSDLEILKMNDQGEVEWAKIIGRSGAESDERPFGGIAITENQDGFIVATSSSQVNGVYDLLIIKLDSGGDTLWTHVYGSENNDFLQLGEIIENENNEQWLFTVQVLDSTKSILNALKINEEGKVCSQFRYNPNGHICIEGSVVVADKIYLTGYVTSISDGQQGIVLIMDNELGFCENDTNAIDYVYKSGGPVFFDNLDMTARENLDEIAWSVRQSQKNFHARQFCTSFSGAPEINSSDTSICLGDSITLQSSIDNVQWYLNGKEGEVISELSSIIVVPQETSTYYAVHSNGKWDSVMVYVKSDTDRDCVAIDVRQNQNTYCPGDTVRLSTTLDDIWWSNVAHPEDTVSVSPVYEFKADSTEKILLNLANGRYGEVDVEVYDIGDPGCFNINIYELISPNYDGANEVFYVEPLNRIYPIYLKVFNINNELVYESENYQNNWNGENLADGWYYYFISTLNNDNEYNGYLLIQR